MTHFGGVLRVDTIRPVVGWLVSGFVGSLVGFKYFLFSPRKLGKLNPF